MANRDRQTALRGLDVQAMCAIRRAIQPDSGSGGLARHSKTESWWHALDEVVPDSFDMYVRLEEHACELRVALAATTLAACGVLDEISHGLARFGGERS